MPIPLSPNDRFGLTLKRDQAVDAAGKPLAQQPPGRPTFYFRCLSGRQQRQMAAMLEELEKQESTLAALDKSYEILRFVLVGWENLQDARKGNETIPYDPQVLEDVLQYQEAQELIYAAWSWRPDVNFSASQSSSPTASSASPGDAAGV